MDARVLPVVAVLALAAAAGCADEQAVAPDPSRDEASIVDALNQWPRDFANKDVAAVCSLFAPDVVVIYPGAEDRDYDATCAQFQRVLTAPDRTFTYAAPEIADVLVDGDLAAVRLVWPLTVTDASGTVLESVRESGVDVFRRQPGGSWKIHVSHAFPLTG
ncbi:YybH family protein [Rhodococcus sp. NPDC127530]|uniref:YybH family protein n=1 Tax=unclassified Rhodococcus (in: high G+C Gram-positive bacteria) TaxID=192944 RepID=UPI003624D089